MLVAVGDPGLRADVRRAAAAAGVPVSEPSAGGHADEPTIGAELDSRVLIGIADWRGADTVVVDAEGAAAVPSGGLPRRERVVVVAAGRAELSHWQLASELGAPGVIVLPRDEAQLVGLIGVTADRSARGGVIAVVGARGGAGSSCFAAALAHVAAGGMTVRGDRPSERRRALLIDADRLGGGLDLLLGWEDRPGIRWPDLVADEGRVACDALFAALPGRDGVALLSGTRSPDATHPGPAAMRAVVDAARFNGDLAVIDCPRISDPAADVAIAGADLVVLVCPATTVAIAAATPVVERLRRVTHDLGVVVRGPSALGRRPGEVAELLDVPLLAAMRPEPGLDQRIDRHGWSPRRRSSRRSPLLAGARTVVQRFADRFDR